MTRNLKALGLALVAVFAMSAIAASAAQAEGQPTWTPASYSAWLTTEAEGTQIYKTNTGQEVQCTGVSANSTIEKAGVEDTIVRATDIKYSGCTAKIGTSSLPATVDMTGCDFRFSGGETDPADKTHYINVIVEIPCPVGVTGPDVTIFETPVKHAAGTALCHITVWDPVTAGTVTYTNVAGTPNYVTVKSAGVTNNVTRSGSILCGNPASATYTGSTLVTAFKDEGLEADKTTPKEGAKIGLTISHL